MDVGSVNATRYARAMMIFFVSYQMIRIQNPNDVARRFDEGKEERERERETAFSNAKAACPPPRKETNDDKSTHLGLGGLEAGDGRDLLSSSKHDYRCVCVCV